MLGDGQHQVGLGQAERSSDHRHQNTDQHQRIGTANECRSLFSGADDYIEVAIGYDSVHIHKPDPYPVRAALEKLEYQTNEAVFVGDSPHDIKSGNDAGVITIAALWGPFRRNQLEPYNPTYFLENIKDLPPLLDRISTKSAG